MLRNLKKNVVLISVLVVVVLMSGLITYQRTRTLPEGIAFAKAPLEGLNRQEALKVIEDELKVFQMKTITLVGRNEQSIRFVPEDLGIEYDAQQTTKRIFDEHIWVIKPFASLSEEPIAELGGAVVHINQELLSQRITEFLTSFETPPTDATVEWNERSWQVQPEALGYRLKANELERIQQNIIQDVQNNSSLALQAGYDPLEPSRTADMMQDMATAMQAIIAEPISWYYGYDTIILDLADAPGWFEIDQEERVFQLDRNFAAKQIAQLAYEYDRDPGKVVVTATEEVVSEYDQQVVNKAVYEGSFQKGRIADQEQWLTDLQEMIADPERERAKELAYQTVEPVITSLVPGLEFPQILSTGISNYRLGSHPNRVQNIKLSLAAMDGIIVQPGEEVSFNRLTGWITLGKGYTKTKIINGGEVVEGVGGGVCQSSTTAYRAILNAGFPVTERRNHTLDISYYHQYGYGLDATVYTDSRSDLKFINDFPGPILIHTYTVDDHYDAYVEFYGTTDGRTVQLTNQPTGNYLFKQWEWKVVWPDREEIRYVKSVYQLPKEEEEEEVNPLEA